jgi:hypothetical protein
LIRAPLPYISQHIVEAPAIGLLFTNPVRVSSRVSLVPGYAVEVAVPGCRRSGSAGGFPFSLGWQAVAVTILNGVSSGAILMDALRDIPDLTQVQRSQLCTVIIEAKNAVWAYYALRDIPDLTQVQRASLQKIAKLAA